ncbi:ATP-binding protein [Sorangium sp. So ce367]|uniref:ATP-binding protein n=1 Tax=Sorangium sp. So ce367 TaxID=3133305 RepID=UPI003F63E983
MVDLSYDEIENLRDLARKLFLPSAPVTTAELLYGRSAQLRQSRTALAIPGRTIFVHGERGVGKTSLAKTVAYEFHHSASEPPYVGCDPDDDFNALAARILRRCLGQLPGIASKEKRVREMGLQLGAIKLLQRLETESASLPDVKLTPDETVEILSALHRINKNPFVVIVDEVDILKNPSIREQIAFFIKALGDHECTMKFIFCRHRARHRFIAVRT